ncbi:ATPase [Kitasatospora sp. NPDC051984]|uniref:RapZ C-terminal domain-containing protein n=1 Tax=Kitasatospora sp. NPDC051984 TaxID=3364059 RepID=UPI0037C9C534
MTDIQITSFGYLHGQAPAAHLTADLRQHFRDPHHDPALRAKTGADPQVMEAVLSTDGIADLIDGLVACVRAYWDGPSAASRTITVAVGCAGGKHRAHVVADELARLLLADGFDVETVHRDSHRPVVERDACGRAAQAGPHSGAVQARG